MIDLNDLLDRIAKLFILFAMVTGFVFIVIGIRCCCIHMGKRTPVEENRQIDSLITVNDSIKIKIENLDSIKNAKIIEVATLSNDSTIKLFYELVSE